MPSQSRVENPLFHPFLFIYQVWQWPVDIILSPTPPEPQQRLERPKIAVIGAGITGVTAASHCIGHGFDVVIFEAGSEENVGGIWSKVNNTSSLQIHSLMYRFHPSVKWEHGYPDRQQIVSQVKQIWKKYGLDTRTSKDVNNKTMIVIGGGASAVEALEYAADEGAKKTYILSRSDKWIIPRNAIVDILLSLNIWGQETTLCWDIAPENKGGFEETPMVNSDVMDRLRSGEAGWVRCDIEGFVERGVIVNQRDKGVPKGGPGRRRTVEGDVVVMATGYKRPPLDFLPDECFEEPYSPPNWYLQVFPPPHPSVAAVNCTYVNAIGTVGNWHIGTYTRILLMFLSDPLTRPEAFWMRRWIDMTRFLKATAPTGAFDFFTYLELVWWFVFCIAFNPFRWKWAFFVFFGLGFALPRRVVEGEDYVRNGLGVGTSSENEGKDTGKSA
ncbi:hypothetical protein DL766_004034 [Monosporascus sp. MC13-8B]|uniref:FAD/NAD(P)-binding domain-containing protein n=1 Tax=Monosporascus cannonballus TaxID=155416 RepID=A0ABY0HG08_9PEZI|nr:hypothetical protein DL762_002638 [Monosporascus cannonballus]RYP32277.1 hypothetical protein DL766_004034 [Monosporascus sp. MC13-8B]